MKDELISKYEEIIAYYDLEYSPLASKAITFTLIEKGKRKLKSELSSLKAEMEKEEKYIYANGAIFCKECGSKLDKDEPED